MIKLRSDVEVWRWSDWSDHGLQRTVGGRFLRLSFNLQSHLVGWRMLVGWRGAGEPVGVVEPRHDGVGPRPRPGPVLDTRPGPRRAGDGVQPGPGSGLVQTATATHTASHHG